MVGGGDGGVLREISKHPDVDEIHLCEIDEVRRSSSLSLPSLVGQTIFICARVRKTVWSEQPTSPCHTGMQYCIKSQGSKIISV